MPLMDYYLQNCNFTETERAIIEMRRKGSSLVGMAQKLNYSSTSSVSDRLASIKRKMEELDRIKPYSG
jgi:DNA-binding NarL/FixJ family response regulator